jgi:hypothetical protein
LDIFNGGCVFLSMVIGEILGYLRFCRGLNGFLNETVSVDKCRGTIAERHRRRGETFLGLLGKKELSIDGSPYRRLFDAVGLSIDDVKLMVPRLGVEGTLEELAKRGAYITVDEFKGRSDCSRNGKVFRFKESDFDNMSLQAGYAATSGGTRSRGTRVFMDFGTIESQTVPWSIMLETNRLQDKPCIVWYPAALGVTVSLVNIKVGKAPIRWFSQVDWTFQPHNATLGKPRDKLMVATTGIIAKIHGIRFPWPTYVPFEGISNVVGAILGAVREQGGVYVPTYPSSALRAAKFARENGKSLEGVTFLVAGEPLTEAKKREIESSGAKVFPQYASTEVGMISFGCANPVKSDDTHLLTDSIVLVQHQRNVKGYGDVNSSLMTSLLPYASKLLLNVEMGDTGVLETRDCGCGWERVGLKTHLHTIRSFEKLTGEGMTFLRADLVRIIEEVLSQKFGGSMTDYQLLEHEDESGLTKMSLLISPDLKGVDEQEVLETIHAELRTKGRDGGSSNVSVDIWEQAKTLTIKREYPKRTLVGKIFSFQTEQPKKQV